MPMTPIVANSQPGEAAPAPGDPVAFELPYFDAILARLELSPESPLSRALQRHVHWGFFSSPDTADDSLAGYVVAAEAMTERVCAAGRVRSGLRILDVGCGFGGTIAHLNEHLSGCKLVGLNIDERQLARARQSVHAGSGNAVTFVQGDACALPFGDGEFDVVMAVECIFHFPSRRRFFKEARRVLRTGGTLVVSDFVVDSEKVDEMTDWTEAHADAQSNFYGVKSAALVSGTYARLARGNHFSELADEDITAATMPTYPGLKNLLSDAGLTDGVKATAYLEELSRMGFFQYRILSFEAEGA
jgi:ubiquinone/menaquinone biosynthesis C-methylase UbiE